MRLLYRIFIAVCIVHLAEHLAQILQLYALNWRLHESKGILGLACPWLAHSETLHYGYAIFMLVGLWALRNEFTGPARWWWMVAFWIQFWHHAEHVLLLYQATTGQNFFGATQPISIIQFTGFAYGTPQDGFGGLLGMSHFGLCDCPGAPPDLVHTWTPALLTVRRPEVHMLYNLAVMVPMAVAMFRNFPVPNRANPRGTQ